MRRICVTSVPPSPCSRRAGGGRRSRRPAASPAMPPGASPSNGSIRRRAPSFPSPSTGAAYARRGTTVIDRDSTNAQGGPIDARASVPTAAGLLAAITANVPQRQAVVPIAAGCACSGRRSVRPCRHTAGPTKAHSGHRAQHQTRSPASPRLGAGSRTRLRDPARRRARHGKRTGGNPYRGLRALAPPDRAHSRRLRTSDTAGAIRRHGGAHKIDRRKLVPYVRRSCEAGMSLSWLREMGP